MSLPLDVIVIGGGHAGAEAANAAARRGAHTLLLTQNLETIGQMSCNPAIGGIAKGTVVREVDALGGIMGRATDRACIQFRMLNRSKGPAVWSPRAQCDRALYRRAVRALLEERPGLRFVQGTVQEILIERGQVRGVVTREGERLLARTVVLTTGTFLSGRIHLGLELQISAGRAGDPASVGISEVLVRNGLRVERFKTGTPPRVDGRTVDLARLQAQPGEPGGYRFSHFVQADRPGEVPCYLTWTTDQTKAVIEGQLTQSALYGGAISGRGPRYCPSIEDKVVKFKDAPRHQVFIEPEGLETCELYLNGLSTSLPPAVQLRFLRTIPGLEQVEMTRPGYAIEYDYFPPDQLDRRLAVRSIEGLFFAGQINGTTGYEEAAGQGIVAGANAAAHALDLPSLELGRDQAMIGVLIDDLITRGVDEPYRLFTSRAEFRLLLRQDNALRRLLPVAARLGFLSSGEEALAAERLEREDQVQQFSAEQTITPEQVNPLFQRLRSSPISEPSRVASLAKRPGVTLAELLDLVGWRGDPADTIWGEIECKYEGYLDRERQAAERLAGMDSFELPEDLTYAALLSLSYESREKLGRIRPATLGQAGRVPGVSPSDLQNLVLEVLRRRRAPGR
jgi:tRNA uridine 5-carboxymethylaminomethyl modification enzyme